MRSRLVVQDVRARIILVRPTGRYVQDAVCDVMGLGGSRIVLTRFFVRLQERTIGVDSPCTLNP